MPLDIEESELEGEVRGGGVMEEETRGRERGEECHVAFRRKTPAGETEPFSFRGDGGYGDAPHFPPFPCCRHADVNGVTRVTHFEETRVRRLFDSEREGGRESMFHGNSDGGAVSGLAFEEKQRKEHEEESTEESYAVGEEAGGRQRGKVYGILLGMDYDPHTIHTIIQKIQQQLRCPQCSRKISVDWHAIRLTGDDFVLLQLRCEACDAYIVLHASCQGVREGETPQDAKLRMLNASSLLARSDIELEKIRESLMKADGSFERMFGEGKSAEHL